MDKPSSVSDIPLFDSLTHPSLDGSWVFPKGDGKNSFDQVALSMRAANVRWAWAVAMGSTGAYDVGRYVDACRRANVKLFPAAYMHAGSFSSVTEIEDWLGDRKERGFLGVKLHPRLEQFDFQNPHLPAIIRASNEFDLVPMLCTYFYSKDNICQTLSTISLRELLHSIPDQKLILLHSGATQLLEVSEMTRPFKNILLDLSFTMCDYVGSSLDLDLRYVMDRCRHRVCIGSDSPEISHKQLRQRFEILTAGFTREHKEQLAHRNLFRFTGLPIEH